jgi:hypothetical protein
MLASLSADMLATDLAKYLVRKGAQNQAAAHFQRGANRTRGGVRPRLGAWAGHPRMCCCVIFCLAPGCLRVIVWDRQDWAVCVRL